MEMSDSNFKFASRHLLFVGSKILFLSLQELSMHTFGFSGASLLALMSLRREQIASERFGDDWQQRCVVGKQMSVEEFSG